MITVDQTLCAGCAMCVTACQEEAIECPGMAVVNMDKCVECLDCLDYCPTDALIHREPAKEKERRVAIALLKENYAKKTG
ncbi:4Fe-4S binding protein [bacterium]|nr:4Fe-4S binding protein [bacterium]